MEVIMTALLTEGQLADHPFLTGATPDFLNHLDEFSDEISFEKGDVILKEGDYADRFYLILTGKVALQTSTNGKPNITVQILGPGDILGWSWLFPPFEWHFGARAIEPCTAVVINGASLLIRAEEDSKFGYELMKRISKHVIQRLQSTRKRFIDEIRRQERTDVYAIHEPDAGG
jgi:CRP-like cAMP-binding protein